VKHTAETGRDPSLPEEFSSKKNEKDRERERERRKN